MDYLNDFDMSHIDVNIKCIKVKKIFKNTIPISEWNSFIYFLKSIGLYEEFFEMLDIEWINKMSTKFRLKGTYFSIVDSFQRHNPPFYWNVVSILNRLRCKVLYGENYLENNFEYNGNDIIDNVSFNQHISTAIKLMDKCKDMLQEQKINRMKELTDYMVKEKERRWK